MTLWPPHRQDGAEFKRNRHSSVPAADEQGVCHPRLTAEELFPQQVLSGSALGRQKSSS